MTEVLMFANEERIVRAMAGVSVFPRTLLPFPQKGGA